jgi:hypothetical protein
VAVEAMAYLRREKEIVEMDFPLDTVWNAIEEVITKLEWKTQKTDESTHQLTVKTKSNFMAYASNLTVEVIKVNDKTSKVTVSAETPVTTITGIIDFGRTTERLDSFLLALVSQLKCKTPADKEENK